MNTWLVAILGLLSLEFFFDLGVDTLNARRFAAGPPPEFEGLFDPDTYRKAREYHLDQFRFSLVRRSVQFAALAAFIVAGGFEQVDRLARAADFGPVGTG